MGARQAWARRCSYWLEPKNWLIVTVVLIGWHADGWAGIGWGLLAALFTAVVPTLFISYGIRHGRWSDRNVGARRPRLAVLAFSAASVAAGLILLATGGAPHLLTGYLAFMLASVALLAAVTTVWKISIHCAVASGSVVILALSFGPLVWPAYALVVLLGWSRVVLKDHTVAQVVAGAVLGAAAAAVAYAVLVSLASANSGCGAAVLPDRTTDRTTARGQDAWTAPMIRSASPA
jgi:membrane-associated phospholipid phosphatase